MKKILGQILGVIIGLLLGFFGVLVSVFADGPLDERMITILVILLIYGILGLIWGWLIPTMSWRWGLYLGTPGSIILLMYSFDETTRAPYYIVYIGLILIITCLCAKVSARLKGIKE